MPFQVSPGVNVSEIDLTTVVPAVATTDGAISGLFNWGPVRERVLIDSEQYLLSRFGSPTNDNAETWFTAASFLSYGNKLHVVRAADSSVLSAFANTGAATANSLNTVLNKTDYLGKDGTFDADIQWIAKYPGSFGNSLRISVCDTANGYTSTINMTADANTTGTFTISVGSNGATVAVSNTASGNLIEANTNALSYASAIAVNDLIEVGNSSVGVQYMKVTSVGSVTSNSTHRYFSVSFNDPLQLHTNISQTSIERFWEFFNVVDSAPGTSEYVTQFGNTSAKDEMHVVVVDAGGKFTKSLGLF